MEPSNYRESSLPADALAPLNGQLFIDLDAGHALAQAIVDTVRDPLVVLDQDLRVVTANRAFHQAFRMNRQDIQGRPVYGLGNGQWDIPELRLLLEDVAPRHAVMEGYEVERDFPLIGRRSMLLSAARCSIKEMLASSFFWQSKMLPIGARPNGRSPICCNRRKRCCRRCQHRVANSLQIIASILRLKARTVRSEKARLHLQDAHRRVLQVAAASSSCWPQSTVNRSRSALISRGCARPWQPR
jgi:two-component sensor histidine kinase